MDETDWDSYGIGKYEKCADCMVHCGFEATAVEEAFSRPCGRSAVALRGIRTEGPMAEDIPLDGQRPADYVFAGTSSTSSRKSVKPRAAASSIFRPRSRADEGGAAHRARSATDAGSAGDRAGSTAPQRRTASVPSGCMPTRAACGTSPLRRIGDDPKSREGKIMGGGDAGRYMRFHVGGECAGLDMQSALGGMVVTGASTPAISTIGAPPRAAARRWTRPVAIESFAGFGDDGARDEEGAGTQPRRQAAGDAEA